MKVSQYLLIDPNKWIVRWFEIKSAKYKLENRFRLNDKLIYPCLAEC